MVTFDSVLNFILPPLILIIGLYILYKAIKPAIEGMGGLFKSGYDKIRGNKEDGGIGISDIRYLEYD